MLKAVDNTTSFPSPPDVQEVVDLLAHLVEQGAIAKCIVLYEDTDGQTGWLTTPFGTVAEQLGFIELVKLEMFHLASHDV